MMPSSFQKFSYSYRNFFFNTTVMINTVLCLLSPLNDTVGISFFVSTQRSLSPIFMAL